MSCSSAYSGCSKRQRNWILVWLGQKDIIRSLDINIKWMKNLALFYNFQAWNFKGVKLLNPDTMKERKGEKRKWKKRKEKEGRQAGMNEFRGRIRFFETRGPRRPGSYVLFCLQFIESPQEGPPFLKEEFDLIFQTTSSLIL